MSSVLKALKKLEDEVAQQSSMLKDIDPKKTIRRKTMGTWLFHSLMSAVLTAAIIIGGGWLLLRQKPVLMKLLRTAFSEEKKPESPAPVIAKNRETSPALPKSEPITRNLPEPARIAKPPVQPTPQLHEKPAIPEIEEKTIPLPPSGNTLIIPSQPTERVFPENPPTQDSAEMSEIEKEVEREIEQAIREESKEPPAPPTMPDKESASPPVPAKEPAPTSAKQIATPEKQIEGLSIQALVWSENPERRMVVVNNQILHTGDMVGNVRIQEIGTDHIIVREGSQQWKVRFQVK